MKYSKGKVSDIQIAYIGGGSRGWAWTFMTDLALEDEISGTIRLYDIDRKAAQTNEVIGNHLMNRPEAKGDWKFEVKDSLKEVLTGCDFAVISILPGTFDEMASDVHLPERLGIYHLDKHQKSTHRVLVKSFLISYDFLLIIDPL